MATTATCPTCNGDGRIITNKCTKCRGEGRIYGEEQITMDIPAGVTDGVQLSMSGKGNAGLRGGPNGDLVISVEETHHEELRRDGNNILYELHLNIADAALGTQVEVPTIDGRAKIKVPAGTQSGKTFRLAGKGVPSVNGYGKGDQLVIVQVFTPTHLSKEEEQLLERLKTSPNFQPGKNQNHDKGKGGIFDFFK